VGATGGTARSPRPKVTETSDSSIATAALWLPESDETGVPAKAGLGCMRIMKRSACKRDASGFGRFTEVISAERDLQKDSN
jgi:hypothetical protein